MRITLTVLACVALTACAPSVPDSGAQGVGFNDYDEYQREKAAREAALTGSSLPPAAPVTSQPIGATSTTAHPHSSTTHTHSNDADTLAAETRAALDSSAANSGVVPVQADPNNSQPQTVSTASGISSENDFEAVGAQRSIESDAQLIAQNRAQYKVIEPTALPQRSGGTGPSIVQYALSATHPVGTQVYRRAGFNKEAKYQRNCAKYSSYEQAQTDFLSKGGPKRDKLGLDPDGDGYACGWDPAPFRKAVASAGGA